MCIRQNNEREHVVFFPFLRKLKVSINNKLLSLIMISSVKVLKYLIVPTLHGTSKV